MTLNRIILSMLFLIMLGCASTQGVKNIAPEIPKDYSGPDAGYLIVSLGASPKTHYTTYTLFFRPKHENMSGNVYYRQEGNIFFPRSERDFDDPNGNGIVYVHRMPAGEYTVVNFRIWQNSGRVQRHFYPKEPFSIPFVIEPGVATYIGEFLADGITGKNFIGMNVPAGAIFKIANKQDRDIPVAKKKYPEIQNIKVAIPASDIENLPLFEKNEMY